MMVTIKMEQKETTVSLLIAPVLSLKQILPVSINTFLKLQFSIVAGRGEQDNRVSAPFAEFRKVIHHSIAMTKGDSNKTVPVQKIHLSFQDRLLQYAS